MLLLGAGFALKKNDKTSTLLSEKYPSYNVCFLMINLHKAAE